MSGMTGSAPGPSPSAAPVPDLPPPGPEEMTALKNLDRIKAKHPQTEAEAKALSTEYEAAMTSASDVAWAIVW